MKERPVAPRFDQGPSRAFFFFGTLLDGDVLALVLGRGVADGDMQAAEIDGFRRVRVQGRAYPMLLPHPGGRVAGRLISGLDAVDVARLRVYEGPEYQIAPILVRTGAAMVKAEMFVCPPALAADRREWSLEQWQLRHKRKVLPGLRQLMAGFGPARARRRPPSAPGA